MKGNRKSFEHLVFNIFKNENEYDKTHYQLMRTYDLMNIKVKAFKKMSLETQYDICNIACIMAMGSSLRQLRVIEILRKNKPVHDIERDYCPEYGFKEIERLQLKSTPLLKQ